MIGLIKNELKYMESYMHSSIPVMCCAFRHHILVSDTWINPYPSFEKPELC